MKNAEIGVPNRLLPLVLRNDKITVLLAPCVEEKEDNRLLGKIKNEEESDNS